MSEGPIKMPKHFMDIDERVEAVWHLLQVPDTAVVALVGMGGIGTIGILLFMLLYLWHLHGLNLDGVYSACLMSFYFSISIS